MRRSVAMSATYAHFDNQPLLDTMQRAFTGPFTTSVWFVLISSTLVTSALYFFLEHRANDGDVDPQGSRLEQALRVRAVTHLGAIHCN